MFKMFLSFTLALSEHVIGDIVIRTCTRELLLRQHLPDTETEGNSPVIFFRTFDFHFSFVKKKKQMFERLFLDIIVIAL
jgi:hypothetical protein